MPQLSRVSYLMANSAGSTSTGGGGGSPTEGYGLTSNRLVYRGPSTMSGNQDGTGVTPVTVLQTHVANPSNLVNRGVSGQSMTATRAYYNADTTQNKTDPQALTIVSLNDVSEDPRTRMIEWNGFRGEILANTSNFLIYNGANRQSETSGSDAWIKKFATYRMMAAQDPGKITRIPYFIDDPEVSPPADAADVSDQLKEVLPTSQSFDGTHPNANGYTVQADKMYWTSVLRFNDALPFIPFTEIYTTASTAQTNGGFVCNVPYDGSLTGVSLTLLNHTDKFALGIVGSDIVVTRANGTLLTEGWYDIKINALKNNITWTFKTRILIGSLDTNCHRVQFGNDGYGAMVMYEGFDGGSGTPLAAGPKMALVVDFEFLPAADGLSCQLIDSGLSGTDAGWGITLAKNTSDNLSFFCRDGTNTTTRFGIANVAGAGASGTRHWFFASCDLSTGSPVGSVYLDSAARTVTTLTGSSNIGLDRRYGFARRVQGAANIGCPIIIGDIFMCADYIDFTNSANRDLFRDPTTKAAANPYGAGGAVTVSGGGTRTPFYLSRGNAADRLWGKNEGYGTYNMGQSTERGRVYGVATQGAWTAIT